MEQESLFFDSPQDAMRHLVRVLGGPKKVGYMLRPGKSPDDAGRWLLNALDGDRREALYFDDVIQLLKLGRQNGCHTAMDELCRHVGYLEPHPLEPDDEIAKLRREYIASVDAMRKLTERMERLATPQENVRSWRA